MILLGMSFKQWLLATTMLRPAYILAQIATSAKYLEKLKQESLAAQVKDYAAG